MTLPKNASPSLGEGRSGAGGPESGSHVLLAQAGSILGAVNTGNGARGARAERRLDPASADPGGTGTAAPRGQVDSPSSSTDLTTQSGSEAKGGVGAGYGVTESVKKIMLAVACMAQEYGHGYLAFQTLTFADGVVDMDEASRRFNSLATNVLNYRYRSGWLDVRHRRRDGTIHFHLVLVCPCDVGTGVIWPPGPWRKATRSEKARTYRSCNEYLHGEWAYWRSITNYDGARPWSAYPFGWTETLPVRDASKAARYMVRYLWRGMKTRLPGDRGRRLFSLSRVTRELVKTHLFRVMVAADHSRRLPRELRYEFEEVDELVHAAYDNRDFHDGPF